MKQTRITSNRDHAEKMVRALIAKDGYCPCKIQKTDDNICPCKEFRETGECCCRLWVEKEEKASE